MEKTSVAKKVIVNRAVKIFEAGDVIFALGTHLSWMQLRPLGHWNWALIRPFADIDHDEVSVPGQGDQCFRPAA